MVCGRPREYGRTSHLKDGHQILIPPVNILKQQLQIERIKMDALLTFSSEWNCLGLLQLKKETATPQK